ncbi:unnamed protein product [Protopolystoma xenopodis]|uniref:Uncharacterized protein n=1 Tax=Protopolystoma xenopodis TaxID=117903 RepID=A0A3S5CII6_9PLAT|nr:unnamed protein product [Protopolystoma xenopodis]
MLNCTAFSGTDHLNHTHSDVERSGDSRQGSTVEAVGPSRADAGQRVSRTRRCHPVDGTGAPTPRRPGGGTEAAREHGRRPPRQNQGESTSRPPNLNPVSGFGFQFHISGLFCSYGTLAAQFHRLPSTLYPSRDSSSLFCS